MVWPPLLKDVYCSALGAGSWCDITSAKPKTRLHHFNIAVVNIGCSLHHTQVNMNHQDIVKQGLYSEQLNLTMWEVTSLWMEDLIQKIFRINSITVLVALHCLRTPLTACVGGICCHACREGWK